MSFRRRAVPVAVTALGAFALAATPAHAAEIAVPCDPAALVQAITTANAAAEPTTLSLAPGCVYSLTTPADPEWALGLPEIRGTTTIDGNHATITRAKDAPRFRLLSNRGELTIRELTLSGGHAPDGTGTDAYGEGRPGQDGGGIQNWRSLTIADSVISGNSAGTGAPGADATATTSAGRGGGGGFGGGIASYSVSGASLTITNSRITGNTTGAGGAGGNGTARKPGGRGGTAGFGGGVDVLSGTTLRITGSEITGNTAGAGGAGGTGGPEGGGAGDGGGGGAGAGVFVSTWAGELRNPVITGTTISGNRAGRGGDAGTAGPGGYSGWAGAGGAGGGLAVFRDTLTLDGGAVTGNTAGEPGTGGNAIPADGGGVYTLDGRVALTNGAVLSGNRPNNCTSVADVPGCVNDTAKTAARDHRADDAAAEQAARRNP